MNERRRTVAAVKRLGSVMLGGDAPCATPGHNAKLGSYTLMHSDGNGHQGTGKMVSMKLFKYQSRFIVTSNCMIMMKWQTSAGSTGCTRTANAECV